LKKTRFLVFFLNKEGLPARNQSTGSETVDRLN